MEELTFNETYTAKTKQLALATIRWYKYLKKEDEIIRIIGKQLIRSVSSTAANFRASCRARSKKEYYAKICIVVEECDETLFWMDLFSELDWIERENLKELQDECLGLLKVLSKTKKNTRNILDKQG